jgi:glutamate dehydrogenase
VEFQPDLELEQVCSESMKEQFATYRKELASVLPESEREKRAALKDRLEAEGLSEEVAQTFLGLMHIRDFLPLIKLTSRAEVELYAASTLLMETRRVFEVGLLFETIAGVPLRDHWDRVARHDLEKRLTSVIHDIVRQVLMEHNSNLDAFVSAQRRRVNAYRELCTRLRATTPVNLHPVAVAVHALEEMLDD